MKCQKCGATLTPEHLYCDVCGAEYRIVPDFEPELEISIARTLSDLSESIQDDQPEPEADKRPVSVLKKRKISPRMAGLFATIGLFTSIGGFTYQNSVPCISHRAERAAEEEQYLEAAGFYEQLKQKQPQVVDWYLSEAAMYLQAGERDAALRLASEALKLEENSEAAYEFLFNLYLEEEGYQEIHNLLSECENERILQKYAPYLSLSPTASHEGGFYDTTLEVALEAASEGQIFYTLDGTTPNRNSDLYQEPIVMGNGTHRLKAILVNPYGVVSEMLLLDFEIAAAIPLAPVIEPANGTYETAGFITVAPEEGTSVYYTTDGTVPTTDSTPYEGPIPMPLGESGFGFVACSEDGIYGEVTRRNYLLNIKTGITMEEAQNLLVQQMIEQGYILDKNGALLDYYGVHRYFYEYPLWLNGKHYYVFAEHYLENEIDRKTGNLYAVEVMQGDCFRLDKTQPQAYRLDRI